MRTGQQQGLEANDRYKMQWGLYASHLLKAKKHKNQSKPDKLTVLWKKFALKFQIYLGKTLR